MNLTYAWATPRRALFVGEPVHVRAARVRQSSAPQFGRVWSPLTAAAVSTRPAGSVRPRRAGVTLPSPTTCAHPNPHRQSSPVRAIGRRYQ